MEIVLDLKCSSGGMTQIYNSMPDTAKTIFMERFNTWSGFIAVVPRPLSLGGLAGFNSSRGTMSIKKSNWSHFEMAIAMSFLCNVRRLLSSV